MSHDFPVISRHCAVQNCDLCVSSSCECPCHSPSNEEILDEDEAPEQEYVETPEPSSPVAAGEIKLGNFEDSVVNVEPVFNIRTLRVSNCQNHSIALDYSYNADTQTLNIVLVQKDFLQ